MGRFTETWTPEMDAILKQSRAAGMFYKDIAKALGVSTNAAIGRGRRLSPAKPIGIPLSEVSTRGCRFPVTPDTMGAKEHLFCGKPSHKSSYCQHHHKVAYRETADARP